MGFRNFDDFLHDGLIEYLDVNEQNNALVYNFLSSKLCACMCVSAVVVNSLTKQTRLRCMSMRWGEMKLTEVQ